MIHHRGLPLRPSEPECSFYMRNGWCSFSETCKFHHPELPDRFQPAAAAWTSPTSAAGAKPQQRELSPSAVGGPNQHNSKQPYKHSKQQYGTYMGAAYMQPLPPMHAGGPSVMVPYGYYHPAMSPDARMCTAVTAPMPYPVFHMRPFMNVPMVGPGPPPYQLAQQMQDLSVAGNSSRTGSSSSRSRGYQGANSSSNSGNSSSSTGRGGRSGGYRDAGNSSGSSYSSRKVAVAAAAEAPNGDGTHTSGKE